MILSDRELRIEVDDGRIRFDPDIDRDVQIQDASIDVRLGQWLRVPRRQEGIILSPKERIRPDLFGEEREIESGGYNLSPGEFVLSHTYEKITLPLDLAARLEGKSSLARLGLVIHFTSGHIAPGFDGIIVLEILNCGPNTITLVPLMPIGQLIFEKLSTVPRKAYGGRYRVQVGP